MIVKDFERVFLISLSCAFIRSEFVCCLWKQVVILLPHFNTGMLSASYIPTRCDRQTLLAAFRNHSILSRTSSNCAKYELIGRKSSLWGPLYWHFFHALARETPVVFDKKQTVATSFLINLIPFILPCRPCRLNSYKEIKALHKKNIRGRAELVAFFDRLHRGISLRLHKEGKLTEKEQVGCSSKVTIY
jgi:hypothetical protein